MKDDTRKLIRILTDNPSTADLLLIQRELGREVVRRTKLRGIAAVTDWWPCTHCGRTSYGPDDHGYRTMGNGDIRGQSWCKRCRSTHTAAWCGRCAH